MIRRTLLLCVCSGMACAVSISGQAAPSAGTTGSVAGPHLVEPGLLSLSLTASGSAIFGYNGANGASDSINIAGTADYVSGSDRHPTSFIYSGGYLFGNNGQPSSSFQNLGISQVYSSRKWTLTGSDIVSYLPVTPRFGLGGVPGVGDVGTAPITTGLLPGDAVLTNYGQRITNDATVGVNYRFTGRTGIRSSGSYITQHFFDNSGIQNNETFAGGELDHQLTRDTLIGGGYTFTRATYPQTNFAFDSNGVSAILQHTFNPQFSVELSAGPQWTTSSNTAVIPSRISVAASLGAFYLLFRYVQPRHQYRLWRTLRFSLGHRQRRGSAYLSPQLIRRPVRKLRTCSEPVQPAGSVHYREFLHCRHPGHASYCRALVGLRQLCRADSVRQPAHRAG